MSGSIKENATESIAPGTIIAGRYRVVHQLGEGGMGSVFLVQHVHTDEQLALKVLNATVVRDAVALERFRREARAPARIQSDHVVRITDADVAPELGGVPFLVMEYLRGEDLDKLQMRRVLLPPSEVVLYLRQAARALDKAHSIGVIHRDLKPENLFLTHREDGTPWIKLLDFGIAKLTDASGDFKKHGSATTTGQIFGTPLYMSPEQAKAESTRICPQTDVWALGLIAHKLLTGKDIWTATTLTHLIAQIAYEPMPVPSQRGVPFGPAYDAWFARCCAREIEQRYPTAGEAVGALADVLGVRDLSASANIASLSVDPIIARTGDLGASQPVLRQSSGALSRTNLSLRDGRSGGRTWLRVGVAVTTFAFGAVIAAVVFRGRSHAPAAPAADPTPIAASSAAPTALDTGPAPVDLGSIDGVPPLSPTVAPAGSTEPAAAGSAKTGRPAPTRRFPSPTPTFKPSLPPPPPSDPLGGRL